MGGDGRQTGIGADYMQQEKKNNRGTVSVSVVIPVFNEESVIGDIVGEVRSRYPDYEVIVVDDGSTDQTAAVAAHAGAVVVRHPYNVGNGAAVKTGIRTARGVLIVLMDGDGQHDPADIWSLLKEADGFDLVVGARKSKGHASVWRRFANWCYNCLATYVTNFPVKDLTSGFRVFHRDTVLQFLNLFPNTFSYPTTSTLAYLRSGHTVRYVSISARPRVGKSKIRLLRDGYRFLLILMRIATLFSPLKIFLPISFFFCGTGMAYYGYTFFAYHRFTNMSALLLSVSVMVFLLGLVSEQITQLRYDRVG